MKVLHRNYNYKCAVCNCEFEEDEHDRFIQLNKAYCSFHCLVKERFNTTPAVIEWLLSENWKRNSPNEFKDWRISQ